MQESESRPSRLDGQIKSEAGQSIVLIALVFVILIGFLGLAVDAGFAFVRSSQFSRAVDSASLAGVVDMTATIEDPIDPSIDLCSGITCADLRAQQFLAANGWPTDTISFFDSMIDTTVQGVPQYTITATWPVDFFFARVLGLSGFPITHSASAAYAAQSDMFTPTEFDQGQIRKASQFIVGEDGCAINGDPVSPRFANSSKANSEKLRFGNVYTYRIRVPQIFTATNTLRIELFDADTTNIQSGPATVTYSNARSGDLSDPVKSCTTIGVNDGDLGKICVVETGEDLVGAFENPFWIVRVDENFDESCNSVGNPGTTNTETTFELYYFDSNDERQTLATYVDDNSNLANTDLKWYTPSGFDVNIGVIPVTDLFRNIFLDVSATGRAKNVWDIRAGPDPSYYADIGLTALASDANERNLQLANNPGVYSTLGIEVFAIGRMPLQHFITGEYSLRLVPLPISLGEGAVYATIFDFDQPNPWSNGATVANFQIDTLPSELPDDPSLAFNIDGLIAYPGPDTTNYESNCNANAGGLNCNGRWLRPQYGLGISSDSFAGGTMIAKYSPNRDEFIWSILVTSGRPVLTR